MALEQKSADRPRARVFISYSRRDMEFADRLETGLKERGLTPLIDRTEIFAFEDWWKRVETLIVKADTIVFVLSPGAISSDICRKEVAFAASLNKRFAPIVCRSVDPAAVPEPLRRLNFIFFTDEAKFDESAGQLVEALETDIEWIRKHTEFGEAARRWAQAGRPGPRGLLLRSPTLEEAERWIAVRPQNAPLPTETTQALIAASRRAATRRRNVLSASLAAGLLMALALMGLAYWQRNVALDQRNRALITQSRFLADQANQLAQQGDQISASLLATEVLPDVASGVDRPLSAEAKAALYQSLNTIHERAILSIPSTSIERSGLSNDNRRLMTTQKDGTLAVWDLAEAKLLGVHGPFDSVAWAIFDPSGDRILISEKNATLHVIDTITGAKAELPAWERNVVAMFDQILDLSSDWKRVILGRTRASATINETTGAVQSSVPLADADKERNLAFLDEGKLIINQTGTVWDAASGKKLADLPVIDRDNSMVTGTAGTTDGSMIAFGGYDASARVFDVSTQQLLFKAKHPESETIKGHERDQATVYGLSFSPDGALLATASADKSVRIWDVNSRRPIAVLRGHEGAVRTVRFLPDGKQLITRSDDGTARIWTWVSNNEIALPKRYGGQIIRPFVRNAAPWLVAFVDESVVVWDATHDSIVATLRGPSPKRFFGPTSRAFINGSGTRLIAMVWNDDKVAWVWDLTSGKELSHVNADPRGPGIEDVGLSADGSLAFAASSDLYIWESDSGKILQTIRTEPSNPNAISRHVFCASFSPDNREIVTPSLLEGIQVWDVNTGVRRRQFRDLKWQCARLSPDGRHIAGFSDSEAFIVDAQSGKSIAALQGHSHFIRTINYSGDGRFITTSSEDSTVRVWNAATGEQLLLMTDVGGILWGTFSPDSKQLITEAGGPVMGSPPPPWRGHIWPLLANTAEMIDAAKQTVRRCLTRNQRQRYFLDPEPPEWCVALEKWPYQTQDWKDWLKYRQAHQSPPLPDTPEWQTWITAHRKPPQ